MYEKVSLALEDYGQHQDIAAFGSTVTSPTSILPQHMMERVMDSLKASPQFEYLPEDGGLEIVDSILKGALVDQAQQGEGFSELHKKLKMEYPALEYKITAFNANLPEASGKPDDNRDVLFIEYTLAYKPVKYRVTIFNMNVVALREILGNLIASFFYFIISTSAIILLISNIIYRVRFTQMKINLTNNMTHELKTPITILYSAAEALDDYNMIEDKAAALDYIRFMKVGLMRMNRMTESLLYFALLDENRLNLVKENVLLQEFFGELEQQFYPLLREKNAKFTYHLQAEELSVTADRAYLNIVFSNLLDNALKYNSYQPLITIKVENAGNYVRILFEDNGMGIPEKFQKDIFNAYYRGIVSDKKIKGYGIGLSYARQILEMHGGSISLLKSQMEQGSVFEIQLPV